MAEKKTEKKKNIYEKMLEVMRSIERLQKDTEVGYNGKAQYKAMSEEKVTSTVRAKFIEQGLVMYPFEQEISKDGNITTTNTKYKLVNVENPEENIVIASSGQGADSQDKGSGKAMTYSFKYALLRTFAIPTGEDPDKVHSDELTDKFKAEEEAKQTKAVQNEAPKQKAKAIKETKPTSVDSKIDYVKKMLEETNANVPAFLEYFSDKYEREIKSVDQMVEAELNEAIKMLDMKKADQDKTPKQVDMKGAING